MKQKQDFLKTALLLNLWQKQPSCLLSDSPALLGEGESTTPGVGGWCWVYLRASTCGTGVTQSCVCDTGRGRTTQNPSSASVNEITAHSQCQVTCNSWQRENIKTIKQFVGFRGIKMSNWRLTTPTQGHFSKLSRELSSINQYKLKLCVNKVASFIGIQMANSDFTPFTHLAWEADNWRANNKRNTHSLLFKTFHLWKTPIFL